MKSSHAEVAALSASIRDYGPMRVMGLDGKIYECEGRNPEIRTHHPLHNDWYAEVRGNSLFIQVPGGLPYSGAATDPLHMTKIKLAGNSLVYLKTTNTFYAEYPEQLESSYSELAVSASIQPNSYKAAQSGVGVIPLVLWKLIGRAVIGGGWIQNILRREY